MPHNSETLFAYRFVWSFLLFGMALTLGIMVFQQFRRLSTRPTTTDLQAKFSDKLDFPAVTICNLNQFYRDRIPNTTIIKNLLYALSDLDSYITLQAVSDDIPGDDVRTFALNAAHRLDEMLKSCYWQSQEFNCSTGFSRTVTAFGVCYTFNGDVSKVRSCRNPGPIGGLRVILNIQQEQYYLSKTFQAGIKV